MSDVHAANGGEPGPVEAEAESKRAKIAERDWINSAGEVVKEEEATACRYKFLADGKAFTYTPGLSSEADKMLSMFGALTLMGNLTNTWKVEKGDRADSPVDVIGERFALLADGKWIDRSAGAVGARVDKDALVAAYVEFAAEKGVSKDPVAVLEKLTDNPQLIKDLRSIPEVLAKYVARVGRGPAKSVEDVLAGV